MKFCSFCNSQNNDSEVGLRSVYEDTRDVDNETAKQTRAGWYCSFPCLYATNHGMTAYCKSDTLFAFKRGDKAYLRYLQRQSNSPHLDAQEKDDIAMEIDRVASLLF